MVFSGYTLEQSTNIRSILSFLILDFLYFCKRLLESLIHKFDFVADLVSGVFLLLSDAAVKKLRKNINELQFVRVTQTRGK